MALPNRAANGRTMFVNGRRAKGSLLSGAVFVAPADGTWQYLTTVQVGMNRNPAWEQEANPTAYSRDGEGSYCYAAVATNEYSVQATQVYFDLPTGFGFMTGYLEVSIVRATSQQVVFSQYLTQAGPDDGAGASFASPVLPEAHYLVRITRLSGVAGYDGIGIRR